MTLGLEEIIRNATSRTLGSVDWLAWKSTDKSSGHGSPKVQN